MKMLSQMFGWLAVIPRWFLDGDGDCEIAVEARVHELEACVASAKRNAAAAIATEWILRCEPRQPHWDAEPSLDSLHVAALEESSRARQLVRELENRLWDARRQRRLLGYAEKQ